MAATYYTNNNYQELAKHFVFASSDLLAFNRSVQYKFVDSLEKLRNSFVKNIESTRILYNALNRDLKSRCSGLMIECNKLSLELAIMDQRIATLKKPSTSSDKGDSKEAAK